jgi:hypothetical protein
VPILVNGSTTAKGAKSQWMGLLQCRGGHLAGRTRQDKNTGEGAGSRGGAMWSRLLAVYYLSMGSQRPNRGGIEGYMKRIPEETTVPMRHAPSMWERRTTEIPGWALTLPWLGPPPKNCSSTPHVSYRGGMYIHTYMHSGCSCIIWACTAEIRARHLTRSPQSCANACPEATAADGQVATEKSGLRAELSRQTPIFSVVFKHKRQLLTQCDCAKGSQDRSQKQAWAVWCVYYLDRGKLCNYRNYDDQAACSSTARYIQEARVPAGWLSGPGSPSSSLCVPVFSA